MSMALPTRPTEIILQLVGIAARAILNHIDGTMVCVYMHVRKVFSLLKVNQHHPSKMH